MGGLDKSVATLRIIGDELDPAAITRLLGCHPSHAAFGIWRLEASERAPGDLDGQIEELLRQVSDDLHVWDTLARTYRVDLFCGLFMESDNEGIALAPESLMALGRRHIRLDLDIYGRGER